MNIIKTFLNLKQIAKEYDFKKISTVILREKFNNKICRPGYKFYLKNFGYKVYNINIAILKLMFIKDIDQKLQKYFFT